MYEHSFADIADNLQQPIHMKYRNFGKRVFDLIASAMGLILVSPLMLLIALLIKLHDGGPIFFLQERIGRYGKPFRIYKFRTMVTNAEQRGPSLTTSNDPRITPIGRLLRKYKLDELPQLINVLKGEMSLVGPRPEIRRYVEMFANEYQQILQIRPGITDFASIQYRNENELLANTDNAEHTYVSVIMPHKIQLAQEYLQNINLITDLKVIMKTLFNR